MHSAKPIRFVAFGVPQLIVGGRAVQLIRRQPVALLSVLALSERSVTRDELSFLIWPDVPQETARQRLRRSLSQLKGAMGQLADAALHLEGQSLRLNDALCEVDAHEFLRLSHRATSTSAPSAIEAAEQATQLCVGPLLQGLDLHEAPEFEQWLLAQRERFQRIQRDVLLRLTDGYVQIKDFPRALEAATRALKLDALAEALHRRAIWLMDQLGRRSDAIRQYVLFASLIERELGVEPDEQTRALYQALLEGKDTAQTRELVFGSHGNTPLVVAQPTGSRSDQALRRLMSDAVTPSAERILERVAAREVAEKPLVIHVQGGAGAGKSHLLERVIQRLRESCPEVALWVCNAAQGYPPPAPFNLIARLLSIALHEQLAQSSSQPLPLPPEVQVASPSEALRVLPELRIVFPQMLPPEKTLSGDLPLVAHRDARLARGRLLASVANALHALSARRRVLIAIDNADQADPDSLEALTRALAGHQAVPMILLLTSRSCPSELETLLEAAQRQGILWTISLESPPHDALVNALTGAGVAREHAVDLLQRSEGMPLALVEMMRAHHLGADPSTLEEALAHNLARLDPISRRIIESVAILGACNLFQVQNMTGQEASAIEAHLDQLVEWDWLAVNGAEYVVAHPEVQQVVLSRMSTARRQRLHQQAARLLTHAQGDLAQIAWHSERAGQREDAAQQWLKAAQRAMDVFALDFALQAIRRGMDATRLPEVQFDLLCVQEAIFHMRGLRDEQAATLDALQTLADKPDAPLTWLAEVRYRQGRHALARNAWKDAVDALQRAAACCLHDDVKVLLLLSRALAGAGQHVEAQRRLEQALALAQQHGDRTEQLQCWIAVAEVALQREQFDEARDALDRAVSLTDRLSSLLPQLLLALGKLASTRNDFTAALAYAQEAQALFARRGIPDGEADAYTLAARMLARLSRLEEAIQAYERAYEGHAALVLRQGMAAARVNAATLALRLGEFALGLGLAQEAYNLFAEIQDGRGLCVSASNIGFALIYLGRADEAEQWLRESHQRSVELQLVAQQASALANLGAALLQQDKLIEARACMEKGLLLRESLGHVDVSVDCAFLAITCLRLDDFVCAEAYSARGVGALAQLPQAENPQQVWFAYAQVMRAQGRFSEARAALERAIALLRQTHQALPAEQGARYLTAFPFNRAILCAWEYDDWPNPPTIA